MKSKNKVVSRICMALSLKMIGLVAGTRCPRDKVAGPANPNLRHPHQPGSVAGCQGSDFRLHRPSLRRQNGFFNFEIATFAPLF
jgi:hypothetical protein